MNPHINMTSVRHWKSEFQGRKQNKQVAKNFVTKKTTNKTKKSKEPQSLEEALVGD